MSVSRANFLYCAVLAASLLWGELLTPAYAGPIITGIVLSNRQAVIDSGGAPIDQNASYNLATLADQHSTIVPNAQGLNDYTFYVASRTTANPISSGLAVLSGSVDSGKRWTINTTGPSPTQLFLSPVLHNTAVVDPTFDLNYAAPGSVLADPTGPPGSMIMVYSATNRSIGLGPPSLTTSNGAYNSVGIATSNDGGRTWPSYAAIGETLPNQSNTGGFNAPNGATANQVCQGSSSSCIPGSGAGYGRYPVLSPATPIPSVQNWGSNGFPTNIGYGSPSGFVDTYSQSTSTYLYIVADFLPGDGTSKLSISRAALNGDSQKISFESSGNGGFPKGAPISFQSGPNSAFGSCQDQARRQRQTAGSISYVPSTGQYLLTFVCMSPEGNPANGAPNGEPYGAWFFSTNSDLSNAGGWSQPRLIQHSESIIRPAIGLNNDLLFDGWYPTFMSPDTVPEGAPGYLGVGELGTDGYVFYMDGSRGDPGLNPRSYNSAYFTLQESSTVAEPDSLTLLAVGLLWLGFGRAPQGGTRRKPGTII